MNGLIGFEKNPPEIVFNLSSFIGFILSKIVGVTYLQFRFYLGGLLMKLIFRLIIAISGKGLLSELSSINSLAVPLKLTGDRASALFIVFTVSSFVSFDLPVILFKSNRPLYPSIDRIPLF